MRVLQELRVSVEDGYPAKVLGSVLQIGREYGLTSYDVAYLELATLDGRLADAAGRAAWSSWSRSPGA